MAEDFELSPRASKRRRTGTYGADRTILRSPEKLGAISNVSNALSSISRRLFSRGKIEVQGEIHDDSAYGSKEESLIEDDLTVPQEGMNVDWAAEGMEMLGREPTGSTMRQKKTGKSNDEEQSTASTDKTQPRLARQNRATFSVNKDSSILKDSEAPAQAIVHDINYRRRVRPSSTQDIASDTAHARKWSSKTRKSSETTEIRVDAGHVEQEDQSASRADTDNREAAGDDEDDEGETQTRSSGRERRRPRRFSNEVVPAKTQKATKKASRIADKATIPAKMIEKVQSPQPKGILTPSKRKRLGPRKSVAFDESEKQIEEQFGFKDIDTSTKMDRSSTASKNQVFSQPASPLTDKFTEVLDGDNETIPTKSTPKAPEPEDELLNDQNYPEDILQSLELPSEDATHLPTTDVEDAPGLTAIKKSIISRLTGAKIASTPQLLSQYNTLHTLLSATITAGESNSLLLLGSRGAGKSLLVNNALNDLSAKHSNDFHIIRLNGFFQTDDKLALREIWRQLGREMQVSEDETGEVTSYADTMASLLSLLSHPEELDDANVMNVDGVERAAKSVIFILDEFDLFTTHPRQTLLYNLFDIAQSRKAPVAVVGCSTRMDVVECLEKRVKSRFSHRWLHIPSITSLNTFQEAVQGALHVAEDGGDAVGLPKSDLEWRARWNDYIKNTFLPSPAIQTRIRQIFHTTKSVPELFAALYIPIATLSIPPPSPSPITNLTATPPARIILPPSSDSTPTILSLLPNLPLLHLSLLIAASRLDAIHNLAALNFTLAYSHYAELVSRTRLQRSAAGMVVAAGGGLRQWSRETARTAWEELGGWEVIVPVAGLGKGAGEDGVGGGGGDAVSSRMWRVDVGLQDVTWAIRQKLGTAGVGEVLGRWCREIVF